MSCPLHLPKTFTTETCGLLLLIYHEHIGSNTHPWDRTGEDFCLKAHQNHEVERDVPSGNGWASDKEGTDEYLNPIIFWWQISPKEITQKETEVIWIKMFIVEIFIIAINWQHPKSLKQDATKQNMVYQ